MQSSSELYALIREQRPDLSDHTIFDWISYLVQLKGCRLFSAVGQAVDEARWLENRKSGIGGSDIAAIMGENPWSSPRIIWLSKTGQFADKVATQSEAAYWGNTLETTVAQEWGKRNNRQWINIPLTLQSIEHPWMLANIDGFTLSDDRKLIEGLLEVKTTTEYNRDAWEEGPIPFYYVCQTNWYCSVTGLSKVDITCLVGGQKLFSLELPCDTELVNRMITVGKEFWFKNVMGLIEPPAEAKDLEGFKDNTDDTQPAKIFADDGTENLAEAYVTLREKIKSLDEVKKQIYAQLFQALDTAPQGLTKTHTLDVRLSERRHCDLATLEKLYPEVYKECVTTKVSRSLSIK